MRSAPTPPSSSGSSSVKVKSSSTSDAIKAAYDKQASEYDTFYSQRSIFAAENLVVQDWLEFHVKGTVLDVGAGTGLFLDLVEQWPEELYVGLDISQKMLEVAALKHPRHRFTLGDMCNMPQIEDSSVDTLVCLWAFQYAMEPYRAAQEFWRVLRPGGKLLMLVNAPAHVYRESYVHAEDDPPAIKWGRSSLYSLFRNYDQLKIHGLNARCDALPDRWTPEGLANCLRLESLMLSWLIPDAFMYLMLEGVK